ncbi:MAG: DHH family phosphoesterase [Verrucomicrobia bacterium]|nr:DHH family phosphoesterase [Verrucomicrobiota bacterium]
MRSGTKWEVAPSPSEAAPLAQALQISPILAQLLWNRGYRDEPVARAFLSAQLRDLADPFLLPGMETAVARALRAIEKRETIVLYGDYDVDGVTSVAMLKRILRMMGAAELRAFLPDRFDEGYGLTTAGVKRCLLEGKPHLAIVLDCGTNSSAEVAALQSDGVDVIILDHHEPSSPAKPLALVNYKVGMQGSAAGVQSSDSENQNDGKWVAEPQTEYCTAGLAFKFCHGLLKSARQSNDPHLRDAISEIDLKGYLDLVALATVSDIASLTGENRIFVKSGLRQMAKTGFVGLRSLMNISGMVAEPRVYDCGFRLGPRLNAAGRLESAMAALELLLSDDEDQANALSRQLDATNRERQAEESRVLAEARADAESQMQDPQTRVIVVSRPGWHEGVVGIVASRLVREFHRPTFVIALDENRNGKGSGRSIEGFNLAQAVEATRRFLLQGGGHAMAAGVALENGRMEEWRTALQTHAIEDQGLDGERLKRVIRADAEVAFSQLNLSLAEELQRLEPCGMGNPRPLLLARKVEVAAEPRKVGADGKHLKLWLRQDGVTIDAIAFGRGALPVRKMDRLDVVFELEINEYQGSKKAQMNLREIAVVTNPPA